LTILGDDASLEKFRKGALSEAERFRTEIILPRYEDLYERVIAANGH
jgi:hypothetical protein